MAVNIGAELQALPLEFLLGSPMVAAIKAQALSAQTTAEFIKEVTLQEDETGNLSAVMVEFSFEQPVPIENQPGEFESKAVILRVPLLSILQAPYLRIQDLNVSFEFKIRDVQSSKTSREITGSTDISISAEEQASLKFGGGFLGFLGGPKGSLSTRRQLDVKVHASATYQRTERQLMDRSATFKLTLKARREEEGISRVKSLLADAVTATPAKEGSPPRE